MDRRSSGHGRDDLAMEKRIVVAESNCCCAQARPPRPTRLASSPAPLLHGAVPHDAGPRCVRPDILPPQELSQGCVGWCGPTPGRRRVVGWMCERPQRCTRDRPRWRSVPTRRGRGLGIPHSRGRRQGLLLRQFRQCACDMVHRAGGYGADLCRNKSCARTTPLNHYNEGRPPPLL